MIDEVEEYCGNFFARDAFDTGTLERKVMKIA